MLEREQDTLEPLRLLIKELRYQFVNHMVRGLSNRTKGERNQLLVGEKARHNGRKERRGEFCEGIPAITAPRKPALASRPLLR
jgi:hypothetical protein